MSGNEKMRKILIVILIILLAILVIIGLSMVTKSGNKNDKEIASKKKSICAEKLCISKVSIEEVEKSKAVYIELENTDDEKIEDICVRIISKELEIPVCIESLEPEKTVNYIYEYNEMFGEKLKDYSLVKETEK